MSTSCNPRPPVVIWHMAIAIGAAISAPIAAVGAEATQVHEWETLQTDNLPHKRHECAFVGCGDEFLLIGGRRVQPVDRFDPATATWTSASAPPIEVHHFQPVVWQEKVLLAGAMTGRYPRETALPHILIYDPAADAWLNGPEIPEDRRRGSAGCVIIGSTLYLVCGIIDGHWSGHVSWLDALDLETGRWTRLPDAPRARDHFQAAVVGNRLYAVGGRRTSAATKETFSLLEPAVDVFDLETGVWRTLGEAPLPTPRAGTATVALGHEVIVLGGETAGQREAHREVEALDTRTERWRRMPDLIHGRHGTGVVLWRDALYIASGSGNRGGGPELESIERLRLGAIRQPPGPHQPESIP